MKLSAIVLAFLAVSATACRKVCPKPTTCACTAAEASTLAALATAQPFPDELGDFPDDPAWTLGPELHRNLPASFKKYADLADLDTKDCKGNVVEQTATHSSGKKYTLLYTDGCDGGNAAGLVLDATGKPVRLIRDYGLEAQPARLIRDYGLEAQPAHQSRKPSK
jgi:hypothetical protein